MRKNIKFVLSILSLLTLVSCAQVQTISSSEISSSKQDSSVEASSMVSSVETSSEVSLIEASSEVISSLEEASSVVSSEAPSEQVISSGEEFYDGYYSSITKSLEGEALQEALSTLINTDAKSIGYAGLWNAYKTTDCIPGTTIIWDMYSNTNYTCGGSNQGANYTKEGDSYNREHAVPQSWFNEASPMVCDLYHVYPTDGYVNNKRGNLNYGEVSSPTYTSTNGSKVGPSSFEGYVDFDNVFEIADEYKGDIARSYFYMATRYGSLITNWDGASSVVFSTSYPYLSEYGIKLFTKWSQQDPVSLKEINRNNAVYTLQNNRNPYIDHPEFANSIFGGTTSTDEVTDEVTNSATTISNLISALPSTITLDNEEAITSCRAAYNNAGSTIRSLINNYQTLINAEKALDDLKASASSVYSFDKGSSSTKLTSGSLNWTSNVTYNGTEARGVQYTLKTIAAAANNQLVLTTNDYKDEISKITLTISTNAENDLSTVAIYVGGEQIGETVSLQKGSYTALEFKSATPLTGEIKIVITTTQESKSIYLSKIQFA